VTEKVRGAIHGNWRRPSLGESWDYASGMGARCRSGRRPGGSVL